MALALALATGYSILLIEGTCAWGWRGEARADTMQCMQSDEATRMHSLRLSFATPQRLSH